MGRELRRVSLDFDWPLDKTWEGFLNPFDVSEPCQHCEHGYSPEAKHLKDLWYGYIPFRPEMKGSTPFTPFTPQVRRRAELNVERASDYYGRGEFAIQREAERLANLFNSAWSYHLNQDEADLLVAEGRLRDLTHDYVAGKGWQLKDPAPAPTALEVNLWNITPGHFGHDSINSWIVIEAECERLGAKTSCQHCGGSGCVWPSEEAKAAFEDWEPTPPPEGPGYQIWETVSEGSPISLVFDTPEGLARYMAGRPWGADDGTSYEAWLSFITGPGWAPSQMSKNGVMMTGVAAMADDQF